jgi:methanethiol S-methyltransferase
VNDLYLLSIYLIAYAALHSLLATDRIKQPLRGCCPGFFRFYRLCYTIVSLIALYPLFAALGSSPDLYAVPGDLYFFFRAIQIISAIGFVWAAKAIDLGLFLGYRTPTVAEDAKSENLSTHGPYRFCRHPLYFFASLFLLAEPSVSQAYALFTGWTVVYFWIGSWIEEHRLIDQFGDTYLEYCNEVPHFLPFPRKRKADLSN